MTRAQGVAVTILAMLSVMAIGWFVGSAIGAPIGAIAGIGMGCMWKRITPRKGQGGAA